MPTRSGLEVVGVDGCPDGWVAVTARGERFSRLEHFSDIRSLVAAHPDAKVVAVDMPLSFPTGCAHRETDLAARARLGKKASSLFPVPQRRFLEASSYAKANAMSKVKCERGISRQAYALRTKIFEVIDFLESSADQRLWEVHPELSFVVLAATSGQTVSYSKRTFRGFAERYRLLETVGLAPPLEPGADLGRATADDVLDAAVAAWSAVRIAGGKAEAIGADASAATTRRVSTAQPYIFV